MKHTMVILRFISTWVYRAVPSRRIRGRKLSVRLQEAQALFQSRLAYIGSMDRYALLQCHRGWFQERLDVAHVLAGSHCFPERAAAAVRRVGTLDDGFQTNFQSSLRNDKSVR